MPTRGLRPRPRGVIASPIPRPSSPSPGGRGQRQDAQLRAGAPGHGHAEEFSRRLARPQAPRRFSRHARQGPFSVGRQGGAEPRKHALLTRFNRRLILFLKGTLVKPAESADKMITLLLEDTFESGSHLDYYDLP